MATKLNNQQLKMLLANMPKMKQSINAVDNTGRTLPRPEENPASKEAFWMWMNQLQNKANGQKRYINDAGPAPVYKNVGEKVRADLEREERQRNLQASIPNEKFNTWVENVGMPAADIGMAIEAGISVPSLLKAMGEKGVQYAGKESLPFTKSNLFSADRSKGIKNYERLLEEAKNMRLDPSLQSQDLRLRLQAQISEIESTLKGLRSGEINDKFTNAIKKEYLKNFKTDEFKRRMYNFMSLRKQIELEAKSKSQLDNLEELVTNSDLTNFKIFKDQIEPGAYYIGDNINSIGVNPEWYETFKNSGKKGLQDYKKLLEHEIQHHYQNILSPVIDDDLTRYEASQLQLLTPDEILSSNIPDAEKKFLIRVRNYFDAANKEKIPIISEVRSDLLNKGILKNKYDKISPEMIDELRKKTLPFEDLGSGVLPSKNMIHNIINSNRLLPILKKGEHNNQILSRIMNNMLGLSGTAIGTNAFLNLINKNKNGN